MFRLLSKQLCAQTEFFITIVSLILSLAASHASSVLFRNYSKIYDGESHRCFREIPERHSKVMRHMMSGAGRVLFRFSFPISLSTSRELT